MMMRGVALLCLVVAIAAVDHPLQMDMSDEFDEPQQNIQVDSSLSDTGPLTRADYNGEEPYETMELEQDADGVTAPAPVPAVHYESVLPTAERAHDAELGYQNNIQATMPTMLADGRLVRVPAEHPRELVAPDTPTAAFGHGSRPSVPEPRRADFEARETKREYGVGSPVDLELLSVEEGTRAKQPDFRPTKKVRVSSLVSGILSSVLSSVLTRGMQFSTAREF